MKGNASPSIAAAHGLSSGRRIDAGTVERLRRRTARLRRLDEVLGGADTYRLYTGELAATITLVDEGSYTDTTGRTLLSVVAEQAQQAGWAAFDAGRHTHARRLFRDSLTAASDAVDTSLIANALAYIAYQKVSTGQPGAGEADASCRVADNDETPATVRALLLERAAWAHAVAGDARQSERALNQAGEACTPRGSPAQKVQGPLATGRSQLAGPAWQQHADRRFPATQHAADHDGGSVHPATRRRRGRAARPHVTAFHFPWGRGRAAQALQEPGELVEDQGRGDGDVEAVAGAGHRDFHGQVEEIEGFGRDAVTFVAEDGDRTGTGGRQVGEPDCFLGQFDAHDVGAIGALPGQPGQRIVHPVHATTVAQSVAAIECLRYPEVAGHRQTGADGIAGAQECAQVGAMLRPERRGDEVVPAGVGAAPSITTQFGTGPDPDRRARGRAHAPEA
ncbi:MAG: hypothetical protein JWN00_784 [Actinomycetia bacterium]|nr:hypothetical protein [Actinomycetes bacterium]